MAGPGRIPGRYNIVVNGEYETFDNQMPVEDFLQCLKDDDVPERTTVVGLEEAYEDGDMIDELAREMDRRGNDLEYQSPTIQFVVEGSFHRSGKTYDLRYEGKLHALQQVFGPQLDRKDAGDWLVAPF